MSIHTDIYTYTHTHTHTYMLCRLLAPPRTVCHHHACSPPLLLLVGVCMCVCACRCVPVVVVRGEEEEEEEEEKGKRARRGRRDKGMETLIILPNDHAVMVVVEGTCVCVEEVKVIVKLEGYSSIAASRSTRSCCLLQKLEGG